jgi:hypothetical protein
MLEESFNNLQAATIVCTGVPLVLTAASAKAIKRNFAQQVGQ